MANAMTRALSPKNNRYLMAVVLGSALTTLAAAAPASVPDLEPRAVNDICRYCTVCWRNARLSPDSWTDCTQEVFCRLMERVSPAAWNRVLDQDSAERLEFLRAIDAVKKRSQRSRKWAGNAVEDVPDGRGPQDRTLADEREVVRLAAEEVLSQRQQQIMQWSFEGWSVQEIATRLDVPAERVSDEKYKAIRKLRTHLSARGEV